MTHEITMKIHQEVEDKKKINMALKALRNDDDEDEQSEEDEDLALIIKKFKRFIKFGKNKGRRSHARKESSNIEKENKDLRLQTQEVDAH